MNNRPPPPPPSKPHLQTSGAQIPGTEPYRDPAWGAEKIQAISILKKFSPEELIILYSSGDFKTIMPHSYAVIEGEPSRGLYVILKGTVSVYKNDPAGSAMHRIAILEEGSYFGELSLFDKHPRAATVAAESVCQMFYLDAERFERFLEERGPDAKIRFYRQCAEELAMRFRSLNADYISSQQLLWKYALRKADDATPNENPGGSSPEET